MRTGDDLGQGAAVEVVTRVVVHHGVVPIVRGVDQLVRLLLLTRAAAMGAGGGGGGGGVERERTAAGRARVAATALRGRRGAW